MREPPGCSSTCTASQHCRGLTHRLVILCACVCAYAHACTCAATNCMCVYMCVCDEMCCCAGPGPRGPAQAAQGQRSGSDHAPSTAPQTMPNYLAQLPCVRTGGHQAGAAGCAAARCCPSLPRRRYHHQGTRVAGAGVCVCVGGGRGGRPQACAGVRHGQGRSASGWQDGQEAGMGITVVVTVLVGSSAATCTWPRCMHVPGAYGTGQNLRMQE